MRNSGTKPARAVKPVFVLVCLICGCGPAVLDSDEAHQSTDALYTAVTSRQLDLLDSVEADLRKLVEEQKLSIDAMDDLGGIIKLARTNKWQQSAEELDHFIRAQPHRTHAH